MSQENVQQFYDMVSNNSEMQERLKTAGSKENFFNMAVQLGQENGYTFTSQEVESFLNQRNQSELSDRELESVAGGEASGFTFCITKSDCWSSIC